MSSWIHRISKIDEGERTAICTACGPVKIKQKGAGRWRCAEGAKRWPDKTSPERRRKKHLKEKYNITEEEVEGMRKAQASACKICKREVSLVVDHSHATGTVRGLLCSACNKMLGFAKDNPAILLEAARYLTSAAGFAIQEEQNEE
jgi:hypothetical protein